MAHKKLKNILFVEDEPDVQLIGEMTLSDIGKYTVKVANNGKEGLEILKDWKPDLVLSDVKMPLMDGREFLLHFKSDPSNSHIAFVFITGVVSSQSAADLLTLKPQGCLVKPYNPQTLCDDLELIWNKFQKKEINNEAFPHTC